MVRLAHRRFALIDTIFGLGDELDVLLELADLFEPDGDAELSHDVPGQVFLERESLS